MLVRQEAKGSIQVIERMMALLDVLSQIEEPATLKILAQRTGLHPSTTHRILGVMCHARLAEHREDGTYALGIRLLELGSIVKSRIEIGAIARPFMQALHKEIGEAINLGIRDRDEIVYVERTSGGHSLVRVIYQVGSRAPLHLTSLGKLFLAAETPAGVQAYAERTGLPGKTVYSLTSFDALEKDLEKVRRTGIAYDVEEAEIGLRCIATPIIDSGGEIAAGLSISAPTDRQRYDWELQLRRTAENISRAIGHLPRTRR